MMSILSTLKATKDMFSLGFSSIEDEKYRLLKDDVCQPNKKNKKPTKQKMLLNLFTPVTQSEMTGDALAVDTISSIEYGATNAGTARRARYAQIHSALHMPFSSN